MKRLFVLIVLLSVLSFPAHAFRGDRNPQVCAGGGGPVVGDIDDTGSNFDVPDNTTLVNADATAGNIIITLPDAATVPNVPYTVIKVDSSTNTVTVVADGGDTIAGSTEYVLNKQYDTLRTNSDGTNYIVVVAMQEPVDVRLFGVVGDGATDDRAAINTAATIANGQDLVFPPGNYKISSNITIDENVVMQQGAFLDADIGVTITLTGSFNAPQVQVFNGAGEIDLTATELNTINPGWWGSGNDAIDHSVVAGGGVTPIEFPPANFSINDHVDLLQSVVILNQGTTLTVASGKTLTIGGEIIAPNTVVFAGDGDVDLSASEQNTINPGWWGSGNDAIDSAVDAGGGTATIEFPPSDFSINDHVDLLESVVILNKGTVLDIDVGKTVTFGGDLIATNTNHFDGDGDVTFEDGSVGTVIPQWFGAVGDGVTDDGPAINDAVAAGGGWEAIELLPATYAIDTNVDLSGKAVKLENGAILDVASGKIFHIGSGRIEAALGSHFIGDGLVTFGDDATLEILPQWWGAIADDSTDCSAAFNKAVTAAYGVAPIYVSGGTYKLLTPITGWNASTGYQTHRGGPDIIGAGMETAILKYYGTSGYAIEVAPTDPLSALNAVNVRIQDIHIQAPNIASQGVTDSGGGILLAGVNGAQLENVALTNFAKTYAYAIHARGRNITESITATARDDDVDFGTTGGGADEKYALQFTPTLTSSVKQATMRLGITGAPAGTVVAYIYDDSSGPDAQVGGASDPITINTISSAADGEDVVFTWTLHSDMPDVTGAGTYWASLETIGYTYTDGVTELRLRTDDSDGTVDTISTYDAAWSFEAGTSDDGYDLTVTTRKGMGVISEFVNVRVQSGTSTLAAVALKLEEGAQAMIRGGTYRGAACVESDGSLIMASGGTEFSASDPGKCLDLTGGNTYWTGCYFEGGTKDVRVSQFTGGTHRFVNSSVGIHIDWTDGTEVYVTNCRGPYVKFDSPAFHDEFFNDYLVDSYSSDLSLNNTTATVDADSMAGQSLVFSTASSGVFLIFQNGAGPSKFLNPGTYLIETWLKDTTHSTDGISLRMRADGVTVATNRYTMTANYEPYRMAFTVSSDTAYQTHLFQILNFKGSNAISFSHLRVRYLGPDTPSNNDLSLYNPAQSDADGARNTSIKFVGDRVAESLNERDFATHANWDTTGDFDDTGGNAAYAHSTGAGTLTQANANLLEDGIDNRQYTFTYTVSGAAGDPAATITTSFALSAQSLTLTDGTQTLNFNSALSASGNDFVISATSDSGDDAFVLDDLSLVVRGASQSVLAEIKVSHDGTGIDEKGKIEFKVNDGDDAFAPTTAVTVDSDGNVGLFETNPAFSLDILRSDRDADLSLQVDTIGTTSSKLQLRNSGNLGITLQSSSSGVGGSLFSQAVGVTDFISASRALTIGTSGASSLFFGTNNATVAKLTSTGAAQFQNSTDSVTGFQVLDADGGTSVLNVDTTNERVGIGTDVPTGLLHIVGVGTGDNGLLFESITGNANISLRADTDSKLPQVKLIDSDTDVVYGSILLDRSASVVTGAVQNDLIIATQSGAGNTIRFAPESVSRMSIDSVGDVTIGPGAKHDGFVTTTPAEVQTTDATQTTLDSITLLDENTYQVKAKILGVKSDGSDRAGYEIVCTVYRTAAGVAVIQGSVTTLHAAESNAACDATFTVSGSDLRASITGIAAETWEWGGHLEYENMSN